MTMQLRARNVRMDRDDTTTPSTWTASIKTPHETITGDPAGTAFYACVALLNKISDRYEDDMHATKEDT